MRQAEISKKILRLAGRTNGQYELIGEGDRVLVGLSGGKDSLTLVHLLKHMQRHAPFDFTFEAVTVSYGMGEDYGHLAKHCEAYDIPHSVYETKIMEIAQEKIRENSSFCSFFSRMRRGSLYTAALERGCNKLALGHHLDDAAESFFMNLFYNGTLRSMPPKYRAYNNLVVVRPLIMARERQLAAFAESNGFATVGDEMCPSLQFDVKMPYVREEMKGFMHELEERYPKLFDSLGAAFRHIHESSFFDQEKLRV